MTTRSSGLGLFWQNVTTLPSSLKESFSRRSTPTSDRARSQSVFANMFLHIHSTRVHPHALRLTYTWGLGVASAALFFILTVTGVLLMIYYKPSTDLAYQSIKDIHYVVPTGRFIRNIHRWASQLMVITVILHMARVFFTGSYKKPREFNWVIGLGLFVLTLALSFTGYLLPWDQLAYWAITIGANIAASPTELTDALRVTHLFNIGAFQKELLLGASEVGQEALIRFYVLHVMLLPILLAVGLSVHIWRVRKDGGLSRPDSVTTSAGKGVGASDPVPQAPSSAPTKTYGLMCVVKGRTPATNQNLDETVPSWPYLLRAELLVLMVCTLFSLALAYFFDAPFEGDGQSWSTGKPREGAVVFSRTSGNGVILRIHRRRCDSCCRYGRARSHSLSGSRTRQGRIVVQRYHWKSRRVAFARIRHNVSDCPGCHPGQLRLAAELVSLDPATVDYLYQSRDNPNSFVCPMVHLRTEAVWIDAHGGDRALYVFPGRVCHSDNGRDDLPRAKLGISIGGRRSGHCIRR